MIGSTECMISFGRGIEVKWERTGNGSLTVSLQPNRASTEKLRPFTFHAEQTDHAILFRGEFAEGQTYSDDDADGDTQVSDDVDKIRDKIRRKWGSHKQLLTDDLVNRWSECPAQFFGVPDFTSSEQWSWNCLNDNEKGGWSLRLPFHKANLFTHLCSRMKKQSLIPRNHHSKAMLRKLYPGFESLSQGDRSPLYARFGRYLKEGAALQRISSSRPGLLLTLAPLLTRKDVEVVSKHCSSPHGSESPWLGSQILDECTKYDHVSLTILTYMTQQPQKSCSISRSLPLKRAVQDPQVDASKRRSPTRLMTDQPPAEERPPLPSSEYQMIEQPTGLSLSYDIHTNQFTPATREGQQPSEEGGTYAPYPGQNTGLISTIWKPAAPLADDPRVFHFHHDVVEGLISDRSRVVRAPSPPLALAVAENLIRNVRVYFENSCRNMRFDYQGTLLDSNGTELHNDLCNDFDSYCFTATMFRERGSHTEFRRALCQASAIVQKILQAEHPRTLACFLEVLIHLIQIGLSDVASHLRHFIQKMSAEVIVPGHPWGRMCQLLGELDAGSLEQALARVWECAINTFESELKPCSRLVVSVRLDYIKRVYGFADHLHEERLLRDSLAQFNGVAKVPTPRVMLNIAHNLNKQKRHDEAEIMAQEVLFLLQKHEMYAERNFERIECKKIMSHSQFHQKKASEAEQTIREAIGMIVDQQGRQHSWYLEFMTVLEGWLRFWGRENEADAVLRETGELVGMGDG